MKTLSTWVQNFKVWLAKHLARFFGAKKTRSHHNADANQSAAFYADVSLQTFKTVVYYIIGVAGVLFCLGLGLLTGYFAAIIDDTPVPTRAALSTTLHNVSQSSSLYFANDVKLSNVKTDLVRQNVDLNQMTPWVTKALVATEDSDFYQHHGVVPKAVVRAVFSDLTGVGSQTGGSTLTQQVVKMQFLSSETTFKRKAVEMMLALRLDHFFSKGEILQAYLNTATLGRNNKGQNIAGVQAAAEGLFGKTAKTLTLPEAAFIAGLPQSPSVYTPYTQSGALKKDLSAGVERQKTVLFRMYRANMLSKTEYNNAKNYDITKDFLPTGKATQSSQEYSYVYNMVNSEATVILAQQLAKEDGHSKAELNNDSSLNQQYTEQATELLTTKGYRVHSTINKQVYDAMQTVVNENKYSFGQTYTSTQINPETGDTEVVQSPVQNGSVLLDNATGAILGFVGGVDGGINHTYTTRSPGSTIKPLLVYGPAVENKLIGTQTMIADFKTNFKNNYSVTDFGGQIQNRFIPAKEALAESYNIPAVNLYQKLRETVNVKPYIDKMGITTLTKNDYSQLGLALGGTDYGVTVQEQASAFSTFARGGTHTDAYVIDAILDPAGNAVYKHKGKTTRVFSPSTSYIMSNMLKGVVTDGTASSLNYQLNFNTDNLIGKTGTSNEYKDIWFIGSTPGVTLASWMGYDNADGRSYNLNESASETNLAYWAKLANASYKLLPNQFKLGSTMERPAGVKSVSVNKQTGQKPGNVTVDGSTYTVNGDSVTGLYNDWEPGVTTANFGIGGTTANYHAFWSRYYGGYYTDATQNYGLVTTEASAVGTAG